MILTSRTGAKIEPFFYLLRKPRFNENRCFSSVKSMILRVGLSKNRWKINPKAYSKNIYQTSSQKMDFGLDVGSILGGLGLQDRRKIEKYWIPNEACFATLWDLPRSRRKATEVVVCKASKWLGIWLGLLHPSIHPSIDLLLVALIIEVNPSTWNVSLMLVPSKI